MSDTTPQKKKISRRAALQYGFMGLATSSLNPTSLSQSTLNTPQYLSKRAKQGRIAVIGAGAFGGWTALHLLRKGVDVTLIDQFGPGNNQASSGGESRIIRPYYWDQQHYFDMVLRSMELWQENEALMDRKIFHKKGLLIFNTAPSNEREQAAEAMYAKAGIPFEKLSPEEAAKRWPQIATEDLDHVMYEPVSGFLEARLGCEGVCKLFIKEGGTYVQQHVGKEVINSGKAQHILLGDGTELEADEYVFACGPWLTRLFPQLTKKLKVMRNACFFFASPPELSDQMENQFPVWLNRNPGGKYGAYGIASNGYRGFKIGFGSNEAAYDITDKFDTYNRFVTPEEVAHAREILSIRFPKLKDRPLIDQRVCQLTNTPDHDFILDKHPEASNLWIMGGGSGHGYKHGASFGEIAAQTISGEKEVMDSFTLNRLLT